jgi:1,4-dihydroxy-2-naphthoyl-CoA hydrolase
MDDVRAVVPFAGQLDIEIADAAPEEVRGVMPWRPELCTVDGVLHGGALMSLADTLGAVCAFLNLREGTTTTTVESKTNFFRAVRGGNVSGVTRPLHAGRRFIVVQTDLRDDERRLVAQTTQTQAVLGGPT